jgi:hypothetical protein
LAQAGDPAEQFLARIQILQVDNLLGFDGSGEEDQASVVVYRHGLCPFRDGILVVIPKPDHDRVLVLDALAASTVPTGYLGRGEDEHEEKVAKSRGILNIRRPGCAFQDTVSAFAPRIMTQPEGLFKIVGANGSI